MYGPEERYASLEPPTSPQLGSPSAGPMTAARKVDRVFTTPLVLSLLLTLLTLPSRADAQAADHPQETSAPAADEASRPVDLAARARELRQWVDAFTHWKEGRDEQRVRPVIRDIGPKPDPPEWLADDCRDLLQEDTGLWAQACQLLTEWQDDEETAQIRAEIAEDRAQGEAPTKTSWWQHVHLDALWPMTQVGSNVYGMVGTHVTVDVAGRFQVFIAPGAMLLSVPAPDGRREWKVATDWGVAYRLTDFTLPGAHRPASLHANFVTAWIVSDPSSLVANRIALAGFSITFRRRPPPEGH
jgi:hypothetical protein